MDVILCENNWCLQSYITQDYGFASFNEQLIIKGMVFIGPLCI